jgi:hypothetical protein
MANQLNAPISKLAVAAAILSAVATFGYVALPMFAVAVVSLPMALIGRRFVLRHSLRGQRLSLASISISSVTLLAAPFWYFHQYNSESMPGYDRVAFESIGAGAGLDQYERQSICIKGYALSSGSSAPQRKIYISPDGRANFKTAILVQLPIAWKYSDDPIAISGVLTVDRQAMRWAPRYRMQATAIRSAKTGTDLMPRAPWDGC